MKIKVDIVLPCYNPSLAWYKELIVFKNFVAEKYQLNFIIVDDGSRARINTQEALEFLPSETRFISYSKNKGKGFALRKGVEFSNSDYTIYTDIDFPFTNESVLAIIDALVANTHDIVVGYRPEKYYENKMSRFRKLLSKAFRYFVKNILKMPISDTQCGLKGFNNKGRKKFLQTSINRYLFDFEFIYLSNKDTSLHIQPVQVNLKENVIFSKMKLRIIIQELLNLSRILIFS